ncbi:zinc finger protein 629-like isoform X2 [Ostrinia furnacalis]|uniref:zinc finger protein 629-like isoform X1 n=1 Tax=Ostrinia furnacalis TaxID=93504 RepID=UPI0010392C69|nr:zinc finger protein 629-like isoform X1 [Ostrinia furnacalis]XP_028176550.1 zinc finger protein 629-like isoform X2 [Ostrinia furnacalis]
MPPKRKKNIKVTRNYNRKVTKKMRPIKSEVKEEIALGNEDIPVCTVCNSGPGRYCQCQQRLLDKIGPKRKAIIKCQKCPKIYKFKKRYLQHCLNEHSTTPGSVSCAQCSVTCPDKKVLAKHIEHTHNRKEFECPRCSKKFVRHAHVLRHLSQSGCNGSPAASYPCEICNSTFSRKDNLIVHLRYQHILNNGYACKLCEYGSKNFSKLVKHWIYTHNDPLKFECDICGKFTSSRTSMAKHLEIHGEKKYICTTCGYSTFTAEVLKRHSLTHVADKPHKCEICGQSYIQRQQLMRHLERHVSSHCNTCGRKFNSKARLLIHQRVHMGLDRLVCPFDTCPNSRKEFSNEISLHNHVQGHLNKKKFPCEVCGKEYFSDVNMRRHLSTHRLDKPRRCMYCVTARAYIRGEQLVRHVRQHHPDLFSTHLAHVRQVMGTNLAIDRVKKSELESILNLLDAESERILDGYGGSDVLYGGMQEDPALAAPAGEVPVKSEPFPLMSEEQLENNLKKLLSQLIDQDTLECFGWPDDSIDSVSATTYDHFSRLCKSFAFV